MLVFFAAVFSLVVVSAAGSQTTPPSPPLPCSTSTSCDSCLQSSRCLWCYTNNTCTDYPARHLLPSPSECQLSHARWGVCWVNFEALIIAMAMVAGGLLLAVSICCCWCYCCRRRRQSGPDREEERFSRRREEIKRRSEERTAERRTRHEDIRKKYGLVTDSNHPYSKFENE